jgi:hypothetical protein
MSTRAKIVFLFFGILTGLITACLGLETRHSNHLGWALLLAGTGFTTIGCLSLGVLFLQDATAEQHADRTLWLPCLAALVISLITPLEYLYLPNVLPRSDHAQDIGLILFAGGLAFYLLSLQSTNTWHAYKSAPDRNRFPLLSTILCPTSASLLLFGLGLGIGFSSWIGLVLSVILLFPCLLYRMTVVT